MRWAWSRSGFHAWLNRTPSARSRSDEAISLQVKASFHCQRPTYGARRVLRDLLADGVECGLHRNRTADALAGLAGATPGGRRLCRRTKAIARLQPLRPNLLDRQFVAERAEPKWIADFTYIWTAEGWALRVGRDRSVLTAGGRLVDERQHDGSSWLPTPC